MNVTPTRTVDALPPELAEWRLWAKETVQIYGLPAEAMSDAELREALDEELMALRRFEREKARRS